MHIDGIEEINVLAKGFDPKWKESCCNSHECFLLDFALAKLLEQPESDLFQTHFIHLFQRILYLLKQFEISLSTEVSNEVFKLIKNSLAHREDFVAHGGIDTLNSFLELHISTCNEHSNGDCEYIKGLHYDLECTQIREKMAPKVTLLLCKWSNEYVAKPEFVQKIYSNLDSAELRNSSLNFIVNDLCQPGRKEVHLPLLRNLFSSKIEFETLSRLLALIFKDNHLATWFLEHSDQFLADGPIVTKLLVADSVISYTAGNNYTWNKLLDEKTVKAAILDLSDTNRCLALKLLCCNPRTSLPVSEQDLVLITDLLILSMTIESPSCRDKMVDSFKKLLTRISAFSHAFFKNKQLDDHLPYLSHFVINLHNIWTESLDKSSNFNRRFFAFQLLQQLHSEILNVKIGDSSLYELLGLQKAVDESYFFDVMVKCLEDSYEKCQSIAAKLLGKVTDNSKWPKFIDETLRKSEDISSTIQHGISYRMRVIIYCCPQAAPDVMQRLGERAKEMSANMKENLTSISTTSPIHTVLNAMSGMLSEVDLADVVIQQKVKANVINTCFAVTEMVNPVLHSISPEGMVLDEEEEDDEVEVPTAVLSQKMQSQRLIVACWRTIKAVSEIFAKIVVRAPENVIKTEWKSDFPLMISYFWNQLTECRHRGAFEMASECFNLVCERFKVLFPDPSHELCPEKWLDDIFHTLKTGEGIHRLCSTRRSAGLPLMVTAILKPFQTKDRFGKNQKLDKAVELLLSNCGKENEVIEVHSVNVLKAIFCNRVFRIQVQPHIELVLSTCIQQISSTNWSIRNAYSQLFSAIALRIFGSQHINTVGTAMSAFEFFTTYQSLYITFLNILEAFDPNNSESVDRANAVLSLLCHIKQTPLRKGERFCLKSYIIPIHKISFLAFSDHSRDFAVKAVKALFEPDSLSDIVVNLYSNVIEKWNEVSSPVLTSTLQLILHLVKSVSSMELINGLVEKIIFVFGNKNNDFRKLTDLTVYQLLSLLLAMRERSVTVPRACYSWCSSSSRRMLPSSKLLSELMYGPCSVYDDYKYVHILVHSHDQDSYIKIDWKSVDELLMKKNKIEEALKVLDGWKGKGEDEEVVKRLAVYLQHESRAVRDEASRHITSLLSSTCLPLFPRVAWLIFTINYPEEIENVKEMNTVLFDEHLLERQPNSSEQRVFEKCNQNTFSEFVQFDFEIEAVKRCLQ